jgi:hypothetical protein
MCSVLAFCVVFTLSSVYAVSIDQTGLDVLLLYAEYFKENALDVQDKLNGTCRFNSVQIFDASKETPTLLLLSQYHAVLVWNSIPFDSPYDLGNVLAQYWDSGGAVVLAEGSLDSSNLGGKFAIPSNGYIFMDTTAGWDDKKDFLGFVALRESPLLSNVSSLRLSGAGARKSTGAIINNGTTVALWNSSKPLIVTGVREGRTIVALNFYPPSYDAPSIDAWWVGDGQNMMASALVFSIHGIKAGA